MSAVAALLAEWDERLDGLREYADDTMSVTELTTLELCRSELAAAMRKDGVE